MELKIEEVKVPAEIGFNYEELKQEIAGKMEFYQNLVYTSDQVKDAKTDRANLNKLKKALNDERIRRKKDYMKPFDDFEKKINEIISIIDKPVALIGEQIEAFDEQRREEKRQEILEKWNELAEAPDFPKQLDLNFIWSDKWLNASYSMTSIAHELRESVQRFKDDVENLSRLPEYGFEACQVYYKTMSTSEALTEVHRLHEVARLKAEEEARLAEVEEARRAEAETDSQMSFQTVEEFDGIVEEARTKDEAEQMEDEEAEWVRFEAKLTTEDAIALKSFFNSRNITFRPI